MKKAVITILPVLTLTLSLCGCGSVDMETGTAPNALEEQKIVIKEDGFFGDQDMADYEDETQYYSSRATLQKQAVEDDLKSEGMAKQYGMRVDKFEITDNSMDPNRSRQVVSCAIKLSNDYCSAEETADISYRYNESCNRWDKERCNIKSKTITPKTSPSDEDIKEMVQSDYNYDKDANLNVGILSKGNADGDVCAYTATAQTVSPIREKGDYYTYTETDMYTVTYKFNPLTGWQGSSHHDSKSRDYRLRSSITGHYEGTTARYNFYTGTQVSDVHYSFDLKVTQDGKNIELSNVMIGSHPYPYPVVDQSSVSASIEKGEHVVFSLASPEGTAHNNHVGTARLLSHTDDDGPSLYFCVEVPTENGGWAMERDFYAPVHA